MTVESHTLKPVSEKTKPNEFEGNSCFKLVFMGSDAPYNVHVTFFVQF
jgi:hypothetical protein